MLTAFIFLSAEFEKELWLTMELLLAFASIARQSVASQRQLDLESKSPQITVLQQP